MSESQSQAVQLVKTGSIPATPAATPGIAQGRELRSDELRRTFDPRLFPFTTTAELPDTLVVLGQERAVEAIQFGIGIRREGYNLFALGPTGSGKHALVRRYLEQRAAAEPAAPDWCYVHNFDQPHRPRAISLPTGRGVTFRDDLARLVEELKTAIRSALETDEYQQRHQQIHDEFKQRREQAIEDLRERAAQRNVSLVRTPMGLALAPVHLGQIIEPDTFERLPEGEQRVFRATIEGFKEELEKILHESPKWHRESQERVRELKHAATSAAVDALIDELKKDYEGQVGVQAYLDALQKDVIENAEDFLQKSGEEASSLDMLFAGMGAASSPLDRYKVNVLADRLPGPGAPVVYEDKPTFQNLVGRIEHVARMGTLVTDFTHVKAGALHRANGGYLIVDARRVLTEPFAWEGLKRALRAHAVRIESLGEALSLVSTVGLDPEPIPLDVKVVLIGDRLLYYLLHQIDPDFMDLFKVAVDFEDSVDRSEANDLMYANMVGAIVRKEGLTPLTAPGVARVLEHGGRVIGDAGKLWLSLEGLSDLLREADYWAGVAGHSAVDRDDVQRAIDAQIHRAGRPQERLQEEIERGTIMIATDGRIVGQANGLSVIELGGFSFARPSRITARVRFGTGKVVDIEREVELGGPIHSKGVLILSGFLAGRYVPDEPLSLSASIVFEQSYGGVEGDSASSAELYALLSALADIPLTQSVAITGSVNQHGEVQAVGGINEKVEGFFDVCKARGLTGEHAVLIPAANKRHLMLREDIVQAVAAGTFHVFAAETVDQGIEILTGVAAGVRDGAGRFPDGTINSRVEQRLMHFAVRARSLTSRAEGEGELKTK